MLQEVAGTAGQWRVQNAHELLMAIDPSFSIRGHHLLGTKEGKTQASFVALGEPVL